MATLHEGKVELAMDAAVRGGFKLVEFTMTTPGWADAVANFAKRTDVMMGVGTVLSVGRRRKKAMDAGLEIYRFTDSHSVGCGVVQRKHDRVHAGLPNAD